MIDLKGNEYNVVDYEEKYKKIQMIELDMLKAVDEICKKYNIKYFLCGGTLLGAVRHSGFIPWDDDLDIFMPREDYIRFSDIADRELPKTMCYQDWKKEIDYPYAFAKIRMNGTVFCQNELAHLNIHHGLFIDIFPLDPIIEDEKKRVRHLKKVNRLKILMSVRYMSLKKNGKLRNPIECFLILLMRLFPKKSIHRIVDRQVMKYDNVNSSLLSQQTGINSLKEVYPFEWFDKQGCISFEGVEFSCMEEKYIDEYLSYFYGDYMTPPPDEKKCQVHDTTEIDFWNYFENKTE